MTFALDPVANVNSIRPLAAFAQSEPQTIPTATWTALAWQRIDAECRDILFDPGVPAQVVPTQPGPFHLRFAFTIEATYRGGIGFGPGCGGKPWLPVQRLLAPGGLLTMLGEDEPAAPERYPIAWDGLVWLREAQSCEVLVWWGGPGPLEIGGGQAHLVMGRLD